MDAGDKLKIDYEQTTQYFHKLADIRFKLLALVPAVTVAAIGLLNNLSGERLLAIGLLGFFAVLGITIYDQRNTQIHDAMQRRAKTLEALIGFESLDKNKKKKGGAFLDRPDRSHRLFGLFLIWHDRGLAIIYASALSGWFYLIINGLIRVIGFESSIAITIIKILVPAIVFLVFFFELHRFDEPTDVPEALSEDVRTLVYYSKKEREFKNDP